MAHWDKLVEASGPTRFGNGCQLRQCEAQKRDGSGRCRQPAVKGQKVCRMHGGFSGRGRKRPAADRSAFFHEYRQPRRLKYEARKAALIDAPEPDFDALSWVSNYRPELSTIDAARTAAAWAYQLHRDGEITWMEFKTQIEIAQSLL